MELMSIPMHTRKTNSTLRHRQRRKMNTSMRCASEKKKRKNKTKLMKIGTE